MNFFSSIGKKFIMGSTGIILLLFVIVHLIGNLGIYIGANKFNSYAEFLKSIPSIVYFIRIFLLICFLLHISMAILLSKNNKLSRPIGYDAVYTITFASSTMLISGSTVLLFFMFHISHLTLGYIYPNVYLLKDSFGRHDVYSMTILSFQHIWISILYIIAQMFIGMHILHGFYSAIQTFGLTSYKYIKLTKIIGNILALSIFICYSSIPISVLLGIIKI